jgi:hypothetical protein
MSQTLNYGICELCHTQGKFIVTHFCDKLDSCAAGGCTFNCPKCGVLQGRFLTSWAVIGQILKAEPLVNHSW